MFIHSMNQLLTIVFQILILIDMKEYRQFWQSPPPNPPLSFLSDIQRRNSQKIQEPEKQSAKISLSDNDYLPFPV